MTISQEQKIDHKHASLQVAINEWFELQFPKAYAALEGTPGNGVVMPDKTALTIDTISLRMASAALEVLKLGLTNAGLEPK